MAASRPVFLKERTVGSNLAGTVADHRKKLTHFPELSALFPYSASSEDAALMRLRGAGLSAT